MSSDGASDSIVYEESNLQLSDAMQKIIDSICCPFCESTDIALETVAFCGCKPKTQKIHLKCIRELVVTSNGYLKCPECLAQFNQYVHETTIDRKFRLEFNLLFPATFLSVFVFAICAYTEMVFFVKLSHTLMTGIAIPTLCSHLITVIVYFIAMILLYNVNARNVFLRYFDRTQGRSVLQYTFACELLCFLLNLMPVFTIKTLYNYSFNFAVWVLGYCILVGPVVAWLVMRHTISEVQSVDRLRYYLRKADTYTPASFQFNRESK